MSVDTALAALPLVVPAGVCDPYAVVVPYSNRYVVVSLLGRTVPFNVAVVAVTALAAPVVAAGGAASAVPVAAKLPIATQIARAVFLMPTPFGPLPFDARAAPGLEAEQGRCARSVAPPLRQGTPLRLFAPLASNRFVTAVGRAQMH